jgi:hypothetical protein
MRLLTSGAPSFSPSVGERMDPGPDIAPLMLVIWPLQTMNLLLTILLKYELMSQRGGGHSADSTVRSWA